MESGVSAELEIVHSRAIRDVIAANEDMFVLLLLLERGLSEILSSIFVLQTQELHIDFT